MKIEDEIEILYEKALLYLKENNLDKAIKCLANVLDLNPKISDIWKLLSNIYLLKKDYKRASYCRKNLKVLKNEEAKKNKLYS